jgi:hypothetical protein
MLQMSRRLVAGEFLMILTTPFQKQPNARAVLAFSLTLADCSVRADKPLYR